jgi:hypothetical protein
MTHSFLQRSSFRRARGLGYVAGMVDWAARWTGALGLLPVAALLVAVIVLRLGAIGFADRSPSARLAFGVTWALGLFCLGVRLVALVHALTSTVLFAALVVVAVAVSLLGQRSPRVPRPERASGFVTRVSALPLAVVLGGVGLIVFAAWLLPVWQWDAIGYHLPFVAFALVGHSFDAVPRDALYLSSYPHNVETLFTAFRALLPDDRLVELAHLPLGLVGALATSALARHAGAGRDMALLAGLAWLGVPVVFLELATNYVDAASASFFLLATYWVLRPPTKRVVVSAGVALGLYLGSKPNAPLPAAALFIVLAVRSWKADLRLPLAAAATVAIVLGGESYVVNWIEHGNPSWPVAMRLGPFSLPGTTTVTALLSAGANAPRPHLSGPLKIVESWTALGAPPVFDMRVGGFGLPFLLALPVAAWAVVKRGKLLWLIPVAASLASPEPSTARFVLAFPALVLALAAAALESLGARARLGLGVGLATVLAATFVYVEPGLVGEGPPLLAYLTMSLEERIRAVGANGRPTPIVDARERLSPGEASAFDAAFDLPYLMWTPDLTRTVVRIPDDADPQGVEGLIREHNVRLLVAGDEKSAGVLARSRPDRFLPLFRCKSDPCTFFRVL